MASHPQQQSAAGSAQADAALKVTALNAKRIAGELQVENAGLKAEVERLERLLSDLGAVDAAERQRAIESLRAMESSVSAQVAAARRELDQVSSAVIVNRDRLVLEEMGLFDFEHPAESSSRLASELEALRSQIRQTNKIGAAITATTNFTFNNSAAKGRQFVNQMSRSCCAPTTPRPRTPSRR